MSGSHVDAIAGHAQRAPQRLAARDLVHGTEWTYAELDALVGRLATRLRAVGCVRGERLVVLARNSVWQAALHFACARLGAIYVPLNWRLSAIEINALLERIAPRLFLADGSCAGVRGAVELAGFVATAAAVEPLPGTGIDPDLPSLIVFTSGTSGKPKGVVLTEASLSQTAMNFTLLTRVEAGSSFLCEAPMFHVIGLVANIRPVLAAGGSIQVSDGFEPARTLRWLSDPRLGISHYVGVPQMMETLRRQPGFDPVPLRRLTALLSGGATHAVDDIAAWLDDGVTMASGFGMSEAGTVFGMPVDAQLIRRKIGSVGVAAPSMQARIVNAAGIDCPLGVPGELWLRGPSLMHGYWRDPLETARAFDAAGWFATGDIVRQDEDGFYWIVDRKKDMYISGGENIFPAEIELVLLEHPDVRECALVGMQDSRWGEVGWLAVVPTRDGVREQALLDWLGQRIARYKLPTQVRIVDALPRTATGKLQKARLKDMLLGSAG